ncbi:unnamed protein product [Pieris macdunnoughi]|uniref:Uncharacterized protein n=1 Tax=Pieris macdunnoughi TaxID=345717 RepID=A0A821TC24_9NEOP|nr:unnamed protein product [Pieris macdunnoughi]
MRYAKRENNYRNGDGSYVAIGDGPDTFFEGSPAISPNRHKVGLPKEKENMAALRLRPHRQEVECSHALGPLDNTFTSFESEVKSHYGTTIKPFYFEIDRAEFQKTRPRRNKRKKTKKTKKKPHKHDQNEAKAKQKSEKKKFVRRFVKVRDDSLSKSREVAKGKPVDIIVHIKMNE